MGTWSVSTSGENYIMEYSNGFKRSIRKNQVIKSNTYLGTEYASSQSPNLVLATILATIKSFSAGISPITFTPDGSNGWDVGIVANPTTVQIPSGVTIDSVDYEIKFYQGGSEINAISGNLTADDTINTGANGAGAYLMQLTYILSDSSYFNTASLIVVNSTDTILHYFKGEGTLVNSVSGMNIDVTASIQTTISSPTITWIAYSGSFSNVGTGTNDVLSLPIGTTVIGYKVALTSDFSDYPDPDLLVGITVVIS